jgi:hypothetical protein
VTPQPWFLVVGVLFILALLGGLLLLAIVRCAAARIGCHLLLLQDQQSWPEPHLQAASRRVLWQPAAYHEYWGYGASSPDPAVEVEFDAVVDIVAVTRTPRGTRSALASRGLEIDPVILSIKEI